jgi:hypothetical protein
MFGDFGKELVMKKILPVILALFVLINLGFSQDEGAAKNRAGQKGLLFTLAGLGDFGVTGNLLGIALPTGGSASQKMAGIGMKFYLSGKWVFRGTVHVGYVKVDASNSPGGGNSTSTTVGFAPGLEYHFVNAKTVTAYIGGSAGVGYYRATSTDPYYGSSTAFTGTVFSLAALFGAELFLSENLSLGAEYQLGGTYQTGKSQMGASSNNLPKTLSLGISTVAVTAAIYW